jgi:YD repeat-containing protein
LKVGYDGNADDDIDDAGDDLVITSPFGSTAITPSHDDNGNLTDDGTYKYTYDAWNRLVKATLNDTDITIQEAEFDGLGRRIKKTVTNSGDLDGTTVYLYNRHQIIETRNGSDEVTLQVYPGTRYIDEVVGLRVKDQGRLYAHQDANWNVTALTDLTGRVIEQYWYSPYGQLEAHVAAHPFDFDDDGDVDAQDIAAGTSGGTCWGDYDGASGDCKRLDADGDRDIDVDDYTIVNNYVAARHSEAALQRIPAASHSRRGNLFAFQGLVIEPEIIGYQLRHRWLSPRLQKFGQRDPLGLGDDPHGETPSKLYTGVCGGWGTCRIKEHDALRVVRPSRVFRDGLNTYSFARSSPVSRRDPFGLSASCGKVSCLCTQSGTSRVTVHEDSDRARSILYLQPPIGPKDGCVTLLIPHGIFCTGSCAEIKDWEAAPGVPILSHECCHECDYQDGGLCKYLDGAINDDCSDPGRRKGAMPDW